MTLLTTNNTPRAGQLAALISENCDESHRGAMRHWPADTDGTFCIALFGKDDYTKGLDSDPVIYARTKAYVHCLYAGLANLLPEGDIEFGTDEHGSTWVILAHFQRHNNRDDYQNEGGDAMVEFWDDIVWGQWKSQLAFKRE